jgi:chromosome condensin MukBEF complex kleisin-like MukF subunit
VIVRVMGEGQYRVADDDAARLNELDERAEQALQRGDEDAFRQALRELGDAVRSSGERLDDADLSASDAVVPPDDLSLEEARELFEGEGLIPDLPVRG